MPERIVNAGEQEKNPDYKELNRRFSVSAEYLQRLDEFAGHLRVDDQTGKLKYEKPNLGEIEDPFVREYQDNFGELLNEFRDKHKERVSKFYSELGSDPLCLDKQVVAGLIIVTYDSRRGVPEALKNYAYDKSDEGRASHKYAVSNPNEAFLGLACIDTNPDKRQRDSVDPTTSAIHEARHYMRSVSDYLIGRDKKIAMKSAYRNGRVTALYGEGKDRLNTIDAFSEDAEIYSKLLKREFNPALDIFRLQRQQAYLDELHSSFLQEKNAWFDVNQKVYSSYESGKHWEIVGNHPADIQATKELVALIQGFYILKCQMHDTLPPQVKNQMKKPEQEFWDKVPKYFSRAGSLIGVARTCVQARDLMKELWEEIKSTNPEITNSPIFNENLVNFEKSWGVENIRKILV